MRLILMILAQALPSWLHLDEPILVVRFVDKFRQEIGAHFFSNKIYVTIFSPGPVGGDLRNRFRHHPWRRLYSRTEVVISSIDPRFALTLHCRTLQLHDAPRKQASPQSGFGLLSICRTIVDLCFLLWCALLTCGMTLNPQVQ